MKFQSGEFPLHRLAKKYGVGYVICGHLHQFIPLSHNGVVYLTVGSSGGGIDRGTNAGQGFDQGWFYGHVMASVKGGSTTFTVNEIGAPWGKGRTVRAPDWEKAFR